ncbi:unnamed protein product [Closterium sp. NIES-64]|nr:unnamed protein product [Closterium sp. NIES-64]
MATTTHAPSLRVSRFSATLHHSTAASSRLSSRLRRCPVSPLSRAPLSATVPRASQLRARLLRGPVRASGGAAGEPQKTHQTMMTKFALAGVFLLGIGAGVSVDTVLNVEPSNVASREVIDRQTPNPDICLANGMSAMVLDQRLFISFNPFNVFNAEVKPGCVLRQSNWHVLESKGLVSSDEVRDCKRNMNTFGFVGDLRESPEVSCVYHSPLLLRLGDSSRNGSLLDAVVLPRLINLVSNLLCQATWLARPLRKLLTTA